MKRLRIVSTILFFLCLCVLCNSCKSGASSGVFLENLESVDALIKAEDYGTAWRMLKKNAKLSRSAADYLSVVRRALVLDKNRYAEKQMRKGLSRFPDNEELLAVYAHFLVSSGKIKAALKYASKLEGGKYGSVYAELRFKTAGQSKVADVNSAVDFFSPHFKQAYIDAAATTGNSAYTRNAAVIEALAGNMDAAFVLHPQTMSVYDTPVFWARIAYDSGNFMQCAEDLTFAEPSPPSQMLLADAFLRGGDEKAAIEAWLNSVDDFPENNPDAWYNASRAALLSGNVGYAYSLLNSMTGKFPDYIPGLVAYARYSVYKMPQAEETVFSSVLRERGLQTLGMELDKMIPRIAPSEALALMEKTLQHNKSALLYLEYMKLRWELDDAQRNIDVIAGDRKRASEIWQAIEDTVREPYGYEPLLVQFGLYYFCRYNMLEQAAELWERWYTSRYASALTENGGTSEPVLHESWEYDMESYIALKQGQYERAERILNAGKNNKKITLPAGALFNTALLYNGSGKRVQAHALYRQVLEMTGDKNLQAEIYYKIAVIQREQNEKRNAVLSLNQALALNPGHTRARLMLKRLDGQKSETETGDKSPV